MPWVLNKNSIKTNKITNKFKQLLLQGIIWIVVTVVMVIAIITKIKLVTPNLPQRKKTLWFREKSNNWLTNLQLSLN